MSEMNRQLKTDALFATAKAYADRGVWLQYDQLSLDRVAQISTRRNCMLPPEAATPEHPIFLDCSSWCWAVYYQTFGYMLESCLTWHMIDICRPRVFYRENTHCETPAELESAKAALKAVLQPGDIVVYQYENGNGHALLYIDDQKYINCSQKGVFNGYSYREKRNIYVPNGSIYIEETRWLFEPNEDPSVGRSYLFSDRVKRFAVIRPLDAVGDPLPRAMARLNEAAGLRCFVTTGYPDGKTARFGGPAVWTLTVENRGSRDLSVCIEKGFGAADAEREETVIAAGASLKSSVETRADAGCAGRPDATPFFTINGLPVWVPEIRTGRVLDDSETEDLLRATSEAEDPARRAFDWYRSKGAPLEADPDRILYRLFSLHDGAAGDVLVRYPEREDDCAAPRLYGGYGVVSPENSESGRSRAAYLTKEQLLPGDIIVAADDALCTQSYAAIYTGSGLLGRFGRRSGADGFGPAGCEGSHSKPSPAPADEGAGKLSGSDMDDYIDSLFGRFVFIVLRPSLSMND